ncbi:hypothetical protein FBEOM_8350 [Fusarium beomiforme]|uniref:Uncharacterized protein n=1 Tax=Fusarium beomiforme TaxID=44412 RepID=A0A9P5DXB0_9HYPO|nr:hypothetical protein FBEOM_8350 [Fusarium beomiforme]
MSWLRSCLIFACIVEGSYDLSKASGPRSSIGNVHALVAIAASYKTLHSIAEDILYHEFAPGYGDSELSEHYTYDLRLNQFMRTVGRRRDLAERVRMVFIHPKHSENPGVEQTIASLHQGASDLGIDIAAAWKDRAADAMDGQRCKGDWKLEYSLEINVDCFCIIKNAPNLEELNVQEDFPRGTDETFADKSKIMTLRIEASYEYSHLRWPIAFAAKDLRSFVFEASNSPIESGNNWPIEEVLSYLHSYFHTLETLHLDFRGKLNIPLFSYYSPDFTLREFYKLRHVSLNTGIVFDVSTEVEDWEIELDEDYLNEIGRGGSVFFSYCIERRRPNFNKGSMDSMISWRLPPSITSLHLACDEGQNIDHVETGLMGLAEAKIGCLDNLKHVCLDYRGRVDDMVHGSMVQAGFNFTYESWPVSFKDLPDL